MTKNTTENGDAMDTLDALDTAQHKPTLVLGGTGKTGRRVAERLTALGRPVRIGSRSGTPPFEWQDRGTWAPALQGVGATYLVYYPDLVAPGAAEAVGAFTELAVRSGVRRLVLLSGRGEEGARQAERVFQDAAGTAGPGGSGPDWTIVRASWFCQNFSEDYLLDPVLGGEIAFPAGNVAEPFVDAEDIADVAVAALTGDGHAGQVYEVTGPRLLTFAEAAREIAEASGREVGYVPVPLEAYAAVLAEQLPAEHAKMLSELFTEVLDGRNAHLSDGVRRALGRAPRDFAEYARTTAATGVWAG